MRSASPSSARSASRGIFEQQPQALALLTGSAQVLFRALGCEQRRFETEVDYICSPLLTLRRILCSTEITNGDFSYLLETTRCGQRSTITTRNSVYSGIATLTVCVTSDITSTITPVQVLLYSEVDRLAASMITNDYAINCDGTVEPPAGFDWYTRAGSMILATPAQVLSAFPITYTPVVSSVKLHLVDAIPCY